jgi:hypothetical protein
MPSSPVGARWLGHPLVNVFLGQRTLSAHVKFVMWDLLAIPVPAFTPLPANISVDLVHDGSSATIIDKQKTDTDGTAAFAIPVLSPEFPNMFFVVHTQDLPIGHGGHAAIPATWSTKGWKSSDGKTLGYNPGFKGTSFGTAAKPIEFDIGLLILMQIKVESTSEPGTTLVMLPNTPVTLHVDSPTMPPTSINKTVDAKGDVQLHSFDIAAGSSVAITLSGKNDTTDGNFPFLKNVETYEYGIPIVTSYTLSPSLTGLVALDSTTIGRGSSGPHTITIYSTTDSRICGAMTVLKNLTELNSLIHYAAPLDCDDYQGKFVNLGSPLFGGLSFPDGSISLPTSFERDREGQIHEFTHQLLWRWGNFSSVSVALDYCFGKGVMNHEWTDLTNTHHALLEGYPEAFAYIFEAEDIKLKRVADQYEVSYLYDGNKDGYKIPVRKAVVAKLSTSILTLLGIFPSETPIAANVLDADLNWGENVEGLFGAALCHLFREYVIPAGTPGWNSRILPTILSGEITGLPQLYWLTASDAGSNAARQRFQNIFVNPAKALSGWDNPTTTLFVDAMRAWNLPDWPIILAILKTYFIGSPQLKAVYLAGDPAPLGAEGLFGFQHQPTDIPAAGGPIEIIGRHLPFDFDTEILIGGTLIPFTIVNPSKITCVAPARPPGTLRTIRLFSPEGNDTLPDALRYV